MSTVLDPGVSYLIHCGTLLQNPTDIITKCHSYFITKCDKSLLQNAPGFLLQKATVLLKNAIVITNCDDFITKCDSYYKMGRLSQIATLQCAFIYFSIFVTTVLFFN